MSRRRRALVAAAVLFPLVAVAAWRLWPHPLTAGERELVGTWRCRWDGWPPERYIEYEFRADRTCNLRQSGMAAMPAAPAYWWRTDDILTVRHPDQARHPLFGWLGVTDPVDEVFVLTPDGPGRFRYVGRIEPSSPASPPVAGTMSRVGP